MRSLRLNLVVVTLAAIGCGDDHSEDADAYRLPELAPPAPVEATPEIAADDARFRVSASDLRYRTPEASARVARIDALIGAGGPSEGGLQGATVRLNRRGGPATTLQADHVTVGRETMALEGRLRIGASSIEVHARGSDAEDLVRRLAAGDARRALGDGSWDATLRLEPLLLSDAADLHRAIPPRGVLRGTVGLHRSGGVLRASSSGLLVTTDSSSVRLSGRVVAGPGEGWRADSLRVVLDRVAPGDWRAWFGTEPPLKAPISGSLLAHGDAAHGVRVEGEILADDTTGNRVHAILTGTARLLPAPRFGLRIETREFHLPNSGPLRLRVSLSGTMDSLVVRGTGSLDSTAGVEPDVHPLLRRLPPALARRLARAELSLDGTLLQRPDARDAVLNLSVRDSAGRRLLAVNGRTGLEPDGAVDLVAVVEPMPLSLLPLPDVVRGLEGLAGGRLEIGGTPAEPRVGGTAFLRDLRLDLPEYGVAIDSARLGLRLDGERIRVMDAVAFQDRGGVRLSGQLHLAGPLDPRAPDRALTGAELELHAELDSLRVIDVDSATARVDGRLELAGPIERPHLGGRVDVIDGRVFEDRLAPAGALDPASPPYLDLVRQAPWPSGRLTAAAANADVDDPAPLTAEVTLGVRPAFRIVDEDSDLGTRGTLVARLDSAGGRVAGDVAIVDGFYAYYGYLFQLVGGAFAVESSDTRLAMSGLLRGSEHPLGVDQGGASGLDRRNPPIGIFGYASETTVLELLRRRTAHTATQAELGALLLFDTPPQAIEGWSNELFWRDTEPDELVGHRSGIQGSGLVWSWIADELYDYIPLDRARLRAGTVRMGSRYPGWLMLGTRLDGAVHLGAQLSGRTSWVFGGGTAPSLGIRYAFRETALEPADRHLELFNEPRFTPRSGLAGSGSTHRVTRRTGLRLRWRWER